MLDFFRALGDPDLRFLWYALLVGVFSSVAFGIMGTFVVTRRITYLAGAISHAVLGGIGIALFLQRSKGWTLATPWVGAIATALLTAWLAGWITLRARQREDTAIGTLWAVGMAVGLLFLAKTPGYVDPMSFLFGDILLISAVDLAIVIALDVVIVTAVVFLYRNFLAVSFDAEFARVRGLPVDALVMVLLTLTALTIVLFIPLVGVVMVVALLTIPAAVAGIVTHRLHTMMSVAIIVCAVSAVSGLGISYTLDLPSGPTIIMVVSAIYFIALGSRKLLSRRS